MTLRTSRVVMTAIVLAAGAASACGLLVDSGELTGGPPAAVDDAAIDVVSEMGNDVGTPIPGDEPVPPDAGPPDVVIGPDAPPSCEPDAGFSCVPEAVSGWDGPFRLYVGNVADAPTCGNVTRVVTANDSLVAPAPASCPACTCQPVTGAGCGKFTLRGTDSSCGSLGFPESPSPNVCLNRTVGSNPDGNGFQSAGLDFSVSKMDGGSCQPAATKPTPTKPAVTWNVEAVGCNNLAPTTPGCAPGTVCAELPHPPFEAKLCIRKDGDIPACPGAPYSQRRVFYRGVTDTRDCGDCGCGAPSPANCVGDAVFTDQSGCSGGSSKPPPGCLARQSGFQYFKLNATPPADAGCPATGGLPTGTVTVTSPITVCCAN